VSGPRQKPPAGPPPSAGVLARYARAYARELGVTEGRVRARISYMILGGLLERAGTDEEGHRFQAAQGHRFPEIELRMIQNIGAVAARVVTPATALALGIAIALLFGNPWTNATSRASRLLLQSSVVGLGFGIPIRVVLAAGGQGIVVTAFFIAAALVAGLILGRWMGIERHTSMLIASGTSICGGSAIAAVGPAIGASLEAMSVSLATVFVLNAVALYVFPVVGHALHLSQHQFGVWAALAIHDTSSVVGASASYGVQALQEATILKLARALWILPLAISAPWIVRHHALGVMLPDDPAAAARRRLVVPWFIALFVAAALARSVSPPSWTATYAAVALAARYTLILTLFLIGLGLTRAQLRAVGARPLLQGLALWIAVATVSLALVYWGA